MNKQKKIYLTTLPVLSVALIVLIVLFAIKMISALFFGVFSGLIVALLVVNVILLFNVYKKIKIKKLEQNKVKSTGDYKTDLYGLLGIPVQYNPDGSVKDVYDLLGIVPVYDDKGNRILTVYELLGIIPKFNEKIEEVPFVFAIKNGVKKIAKVDLSSRVLTRKLSEEEKEQAAIREALTQKLKEAEKKGEVQKQEAIKNILSDNNKKKQDKSGGGDNKPKYKLGKSAGAINTQSVSKTIALSKLERTDAFKFASDIFKVSADKISVRAKESGGQQGNNENQNSGAVVANQQSKGNSDKNQPKGLTNLTSIAIKVDDEERVL